jgi:hypothetical protein
MRRDPGHGLAIRLPSRDGGVLTAGTTTHEGDRERCEHSHAAVMAQRAPDVKHAQ